MFPDCRAAQAARAVALLRAGKKAGAASLAAKVEGPGGSVTRDYALACYHLMSGDRVGAMARLRSSLNRGYRDTDLEHDPNLAALKDDPEFRSLAEKMKERLRSHRAAIPGAR
jgi:hypothetical protein